MLFSDTGTVSSDAGTLSSDMGTGSKCVSEIGEYSERYRCPTQNQNLPEEIILCKRIKNTGIPLAVDFQCESNEPLLRGNS
jgi:hypothetical protein